MARTRAYRRAQKDRARRKAIHLIDQVWGVFDAARSFPRGPNYDPVASRERMIHQYTETRKPCSCAGCGNWRKLYGPTFQEQRHLEAHEFTTHIRQYANKDFTDSD